MGAILGIDLGTTFSAIARLDETGRPVMIYESAQESLIPSVVRFNSDRSVTVGKEAEPELEQPNVFGRFKRQLGDGTSLEHHWGRVTPQELSAHVLRKMKSEAERLTGESISDAVVTVPANFSNEARESTLAAARSASIPVQHIINEPTAAALYFAHKSGTELAGNYVVFDLGGGTFDVTIIKVNGQDIDVLATEGIARLGGDDFDAAMRQIVQRKYKLETGAELEDRDFTRTEAETLKKDLSKSNSKLVRVSGPAGRVDVRIDRSEFEEAISSQIAQIELLCETAVEEAKLALQDISAVILAGGSTRMPIVQDAIRRVFDQEPKSVGNPDEMIALGAALYAGYRAKPSNLNPLQQQSVAGIRLAEIAPKFFGTVSLGYNAKQNLEEMQNSIVIRKGQKLPAEVTETFYTIRPGQTEVNCKVTEANSPESDLRFVRTIWEGSLGPLPGDRPEGRPIEVTFSYDLNGIMKCSFKDVESGQSSEVELSMQIKAEADKLDIEKFTVE